MKLLLTADRLRSLVNGAKTEKELESVLRSHKIRYSWTTAPGFTAVKVPIRSGSVYVYRTCSRSAPFMVRSATPEHYPYPLPCLSWDD